ncbi:hypothetical protein [uncultured Sulfitobacter sp.]|uniref:hypothetical protein n=1 Tax=uncultured Sulfitobacter sp. TaxID=191468 RepID=UPI00260B20E3|nr:hypothetical protein [uncultured Sulfitobacter sp.]
MSGLLAELWGIIEPVHQFLSAVAISLVTALLVAMFQPRVKITWGSTNMSFHKFKLDPENEPIVISTEKLFIQNTGRKAAAGIELILNDIPSSYTIWSPREHTSKALEKGGFSILIPTLAPRELLIVDLIDIDRRNLQLIAVNCPDTLTKQVRFLAQRQFGTPVNAAVAYLMFAGFVGTIYVILNLLSGGQ